MKTRWGECLRRREEFFEKGFFGGETSQIFGQDDDGLRDKLVIGRPFNGVKNDVSIGGVGDECESVGSVEGGAVDLDRERIGEDEWIFKNRLNLFEGEARGEFEDFAFLGVIGAQGDWLGGWVRGGGLSCGLIRVGFGKLGSRLGF